MIKDIKVHVSVSQADFKPSPGADVLNVKMLYFIVFFLIRTMVSGKV